MSDSSVVALDVGGTSIKGWLIDAAGRVCAELERPTPVADGPDAVVAGLRGAARTLAVARPDAAAPVAAGVVVPGVVDADAGVAAYSANLGWRDVPLGRLLAADLDLPVAVGHDVAAAGLAESTLGRARGAHDCLMVVIGTGIAGVLVADGTALRGATGTAGEIGHVPVYPDGEPCACGQRGCLETYASAASLARRYAAAGGVGPATARDIVAEIANDPVAAQVWRDAVDALAVALVAATMLLDPALIVLGGGLAEAGDALLAPVCDGLAARLAWRPAPELAVSPLASRAGRVGAAILAWRAAGAEPFRSWTDRVGEPA
ncbi:MAG TPA: ROK family protein [Jatrophihabitans sp.]|nr:ROK family protein [Jatrophihabitans sp.]